MTQTRHSLLQSLAAILRLFRSAGIQHDAGTIINPRNVDGVPDNLRQDVGLPPPIERPPPLNLIRFY